MVLSALYVALWTVVCVLFGNAWRAGLSKVEIMRWQGAYKVLASNHLTLEMKSCGIASTCLVMLHTLQLTLAWSNVGTSLSLRSLCGKASYVAAMILQSHSIT